MKHTVLENTDPSSKVPLVSVIIPTYNRSRLLRLAIESVLAQTYPAIEIIVVDDGSTDDTAAMLEQYAGRLTYIRQANQGGTAARNAGLRAASGEYLTFLDHDDLMLPTKIERQVQMLNARPEIGLVHCRWHFIDQDGNRLDKIGVLPEGDVLKRLVCGCFLWSGGPLIRRQCLDKVGLFDEAIWSSDWDMWMRIAQAGYPFGCVQEPLGSYRILPDSTMSDVARTEQADVAILDKVFADPHLPADVATVKNQAYAIWRFWLSRRYYATGCWDAAQRNLAKALTLHPQLLKDHMEFLQTLCNEALDVRVADPFQFIDGVFGHLPPAAEAIRPYRSYLLSCTYAGLALRNYGFGGIAAAKRQLTTAITLYPALLEQPEDFARMLCAYAMRLPVSPHLYVMTVLQNLPAGARRLERVQSRVLSDVNIARAFEDHFTGHYDLAARRILSALRYRPSWLGNRGVVAVLMKSLGGLLSREQEVER